MRTSNIIGPWPDPLHALTSRYWRRDVYLQNNKDGSARSLQAPAQPWGQYQYHRPLNGTILHLKNPVVLAPRTSRRRPIVLYQETSACYRSTPTHIGILLTPPINAKPYHVGIHWTAITEHSQISTHVPGFQSFLRAWRWRPIVFYQEPSAFYRSTPTHSGILLTLMLLVANLANTK